MIPGRRSSLLLAAAVVAAEAVAVAATLVACSDRAATPSVSQPRTETQTGSTAEPPPPPARSAAWPLEAVMRRIDGARVVVAGRALRVDSATTLCSGLGKAVGSRTRRWYGFACTYTLFRNGIDRDIEFRVTPRGAKRFLIDDARWIPDQR